MAVAAAWFDTVGDAAPTQSAGEPAIPRHLLLKEFRQRIDPHSPRLGSYERIPSKRGGRVTQEEVAEAIGVTRSWYAMLESTADARTSTMLLDRLADTLMISAEERVALFHVAIPELRLGTVHHVVDVDAAAYAFAQARQRFHRTGTTDEVALRSRVKASWQRCRGFGVDPDGAAPLYRADFADRRRKNEGLLRAAAPIVADLADAFAGTGYAVIIADSEGTVLETRADPLTLRRLAKMRLEPSGRLGGVSIWNQCDRNWGRGPIQLVASEHFCEGATRFTCTAAPIFVPGTLELAGVLDLSAPYRRFRPHLLGVVLEAALEIEERMPRQPEEPITF